MKSPFIIIISSLFFILLSFNAIAQEGYISSKHQAKMEKRAGREIKMYTKSNYQVYDSPLSLEAAIQEYYRYHFMEIAEGVRMYATPTAMSREKSLDKSVAKARIKAKNSALGIMQLYFYSWIKIDERTSQEQKDALIKAAEKAEPDIKEMIDGMDPIRSYALYKKLKRDYRVELRTVYDQELLKKNIRALIIEHLDKKELFEGLNIEDLLTFEK